MTDLDLQTMRLLADSSGWLSGREIAARLPVDWRNKRATSPQAMARYGGMRGARLVKLGFARSASIDEGWRTGYAITDNGRRRTGRPKGRGPMSRRGEELEMMGSKPTGLAWVFVEPTRHPRAELTAPQS